jgi:4-hydroxybenzoate polyprenyltransferase
MLGMQVSIGAANDLADATLDARNKPRKPIPAGLVPVGLARGVAFGGAAVGLALSAISGLETGLAALGCLGLGYAYDLRLSRTSLSWLPLAVALPLLPIHAWLGATGAIPGSLRTLLPIGVLAGAGLALANGLVDVERDASGGRRAIAVALGRRRTWVLQTLVLAATAALVVAFAPVAPGGGAETVDGMAGALGFIRRWGFVIGVAVMALGALLLRANRAAIRERGWELEAAAVAALGLGWLAGTAAAGAS